LKRIVVFASGSGSNFQSILDSIHNGSLPVSCVGLICDREGIYAIERAQKLDIPVYVIRRRDYEEVTLYALSLFATLQALDPDLIVLAGYLSKVPEMVVTHWTGRIINIHPALLPKYGGKGYYGLKVHQAVLDASETETGCTVHFVDEVYDRGSIIEQVVVPVKHDDTPETLQQRVLEQEHLLLPKVIRELLINKSQD